MASTHAETAKAIRKELKNLFPACKFRVNSQSFSGGTAVDVKWTDGPTVAAVDSVVNKYQYGHFDGMTDYYDASNRRNDIPQAKYVHTHRSFSEGVRAAATAKVAKYWGIQDFDENKFYPEQNAWGSTLVGRSLQDTSL